MVLRAVVSAVSMVIPIFASIVTFIVYSLAGGELDAARIFSSLTLFNIIRLPLMFLPILTASLTDALVSVGRIQSLLVAEELDFLPKIVESGDFAVKITDGEFLWESAPPAEEVSTKKDSKKNEGKSQKMWSNHKKKVMKKVEKSNEI